MVADTAREADIVKVLAFACERSGRPPLRAIFHCAGVSIDKSILELEGSDWLRTAGPKAAGALYLHQHSLGIPLEHFVVISSCSVNHGADTVGAYVSANAFLDSLMRLRHAQGLPAHSLNMASLSDAGMLFNDYRSRQVQLNSGMEFASTEAAIDALESLIGCGIVHGSQTYFRIKQARWSYPTLSSFIHGDPEVLTLGLDKGKTLRTLQSDEVLGVIIEQLKAVGGLDDISPSSVLSAAGLDSFSTVAFTFRLKQEMGIDVAVGKLGPTTTVADLAKIAAKLQHQQRDERGAAVSQPMSTSFRPTRIPVAHPGPLPSVPPLTGAREEQSQFGSHGSKCCVDPERMG